MIISRKLEILEGKKKKKLSLIFTLDSGPRIQNITFYGFMEICLKVGLSFKKILRQGFE